MAFVKQELERPDLEIVTLALFSDDLEAMKKVNKEQLKLIGKFLVIPFDSSPTINFIDLEDPTTGKSIFDGRGACKSMIYSFDMFFLGVQKGWEQKYMTVSDVPRKSQFFTKNRFDQH